VALGLLCHVIVGRGLLDLRKQPIDRTKRLQETIPFESEQLKGIVVPEEQQPLILGWTELYSKRELMRVLTEDYIPTKCRYQCEFSDNRSRYQLAKKL